MYIKNVIGNAKNGYNGSAVEVRLDDHTLVRRILNVPHRNGKKYCEGHKSGQYGQAYAAAIEAAKRIEAGLDHKPQGEDTGGEFLTTGGVAPQEVSQPAQAAPQVQPAPQAQPQVPRARRTQQQQVMANGSYLFEVSNNGCVMMQGSKDQIRAPFLQDALQVLSNVDNIKSVEAADAGGASWLVRKTEYRVSH